MRRLITDLKESRIAILVLVVYGIIFQTAFGTICPFKALLHINCPGCGLTHSCIYILTGRFELAAEWNILGYVWLPFLVCLCVDRYVLGRESRWGLPVAALIGLLTIFRWVLLFII